MNSVKVKGRNVSRVSVEQGVERCDHRDAGRIGRVHRVSLAHEFRVDEVVAGGGVNERGVVVVLVKLGRAGANVEFVAVVELACTAGGGGAVALKSVAAVGGAERDRVETARMEAVTASVAFVLVMLVAFAASVMAVSSVTEAFRDGPSAAFTTPGMCCTSGLLP